MTERFQRPGVLPDPYEVIVQGVLRECLGMAIEAVENPTSDPKAICAVIAARAEIALNGGRCMVEMVDAGRCPDQAGPGNYECGGHKPGDSASITALTDERPPDAK